MKPDNRQKLINYFQGGATPPEKRKIGLELEHFVIEAETRKTIGYYDGIEEILQELAPQFQETIESQGHIIGLKGKDMIITLEPGAQLEVSLCPHRSIHGIRNNYRKFLKILAPSLVKRGYELANLGYQPRNKAADMSLIPKERYELMDAYFQTKGSRGINMMRGSAATQVSLDYIDEEDFRCIYNVASILSPLLALLTDNSPIFEGARYNQHLARTMIWNDVDFSRPVNPDFSLQEGTGFGDYADFILNHPCILVPDGDKMRYTGETPVKEIYREQEMTDEDIEHVLSMFFPDIRLKNFLEIRMADSMDMPFALSYAALLKGLFYCEANKERFYAMKSNYTVADIAAAKEALMRDGYQAKVYGESPQYILNTIFTFAEGGLEQEEKVYLAPLAAIVNKGETLASAAKEHYNL